MTNHEIEENARLDEKIAAGDFDAEDDEPQLELWWVCDYCGRPSEACTAARTGHSITEVPLGRYERNR